MARKIVLASGKGGVGKSSLTAGIAIELCNMGQNVLVVDFDIGMGCLDLILASDDTGIFNWGDIITGSCEPMQALRSTVGPSLLTAPAYFSESYTEQSVHEMIENFDDSFDYILMDAPAGVSGGFLLSAACADEAIIVSTADEVCVRVGSFAGEKLSSLGVRETKLIINRFNKKQTTRGHYLNIDEVIDATSLQLIGVVPEDNKISYCSVTGMSNLESSKAKEAFKRIAMRLKGFNINLKL